MTADGPRRALVTGGAGFLGSHFVRAWLRGGLGEVTNIDLLTYAGSEARLADVQADPRFRFVRADVTDADTVGAVLGEARPDLVVHFAAESHVTRSERDAERFHRTNVEGTRVMLEAAAGQGVRRFIHVSTDEVYGPTLEGSFREEDKEAGDRLATSAYAKSKALADDEARSFQGIEVVVLRPTNCFGPWQFPEKAFARWVTRALRGEPIPVWGDGLYVRQWLAAEDLAEAVLLVASADRPEPVYNVGPRHEPEITNLDLARWLAEYLELPSEGVLLTEYDRPDHDRRYAVDPSRIERLGWRASDPWERFASTVEWYRGAESWWKPLLEEAESIYRDDRPG
jgi:dTDP-glucose 4,6-dehydratase